MDNDLPEFGDDDNEEDEKAEFVPAYDQECVLCGASPTVVLQYMSSGKILDDTMLCGPCMFGEARFIDPLEW